MTDNPHDAEGRQQDAGGRTGGGAGMTADLCDGEICVDCCLCAKCGRYVGTPHMPVCACLPEAHHWRCRDCAARFVAGVLAPYQDYADLEARLSAAETGRREAEAERDRLREQVQELSDILADRYEVYGKESARAERFKVALETVKQRAGRRMDEGDKTWLTQNVYAVADTALRDALTEAGDASI